MNTIKKILQATPGTTIKVKPDFFVLTDGEAKTVPSLLEGKTIADVDKVKVFIDHETPCGSEKHADFQKALITFACEHGCQLYNGYGVSYQLMLDEHVKSGTLIAHCGNFGSIYGVKDAAAVKLTDEELTAAIESGELELTVPERVELKLTGKLSAPTCAKDAALFAVKLLGDISGKLLLVSGSEALGCEAERTAFFQLLSLSGCCAALCAENAEDSVATLELDVVLPAAAGPACFTDAVTAASLSDVAVSSVFIGGCSAGRIEDIRGAAAVIKGRHVARSVRALLAFATTAVYVQAANEGLIDAFMDAGVLVMNQGCSACFAHSQGLADSKDVVLSAGSRAVPDCMGEGSVPTYLCSAASAMESAITGYITPAGK